MQGDREKGLPLVGLKKLKKMLKACKMEIKAPQNIEEEGEIGESSDSVAIENKCDSKCSGYCPGMNFCFVLNLHFFSFWLFGKFVGYRCN